MKRLAVLLLALAACPPREPAVSHPDPSMTPPPAPVVLPCIPAATTKLTDIVADGKRIRYCAGAECFSISPDVADVSGFAKADKPVPATDAAYVETTQPRIEVCNSVDCTSLTDKVMPIAKDIRAATTTNGAFAAFLFGGNTAKGYVELWDVQDSKKRATIKLPRAGCGDVAFLDKTLLLKCGNQATLFSLQGKKLADAGGKAFTFSAYAPLDGNTYAFLDERGTRVALQDIARGTVLKIVDTSGLFLIGGAQQGTPGESRLVKLGDGRVAVIASPPALGSVATIDPKTGELNLRQAPLCR